MAGEDQLTDTRDRFNMGPDQEENAIVTSTGEYVVAWDFAKVKKGQLDKYEIKKYEDSVVQDNFKFNDSKEIVRPGIRFSRLLGTLTCGSYRLSRWRTMSSQSTRSSSSGRRVPRSRRRQRTCEVARTSSMLRSKVRLLRTVRTVRRLKGLDSDVYAMTLSCSNT